MSFQINIILSTYKDIAASSSFFASARDTQTSCNAHLKENTNTANFPTMIYLLGTILLKFQARSHTVLMVKWILKSLQFAII